MEKEFICNAGRYSVEIKDKTVVNLINKIDKNVECGNIICSYDDNKKPTHPFDYIEIANIMYMRNSIEENEFNHFKDWLYKNAF